jgi:hypothetical protein
MADLEKEWSHPIKAWVGNITAYTVLGSFALYLCGYLSLRFHLTVLGIGTDLALLDERYLFAGARFLVYLVTSVPTIILILLIVWILVWVLSLPYRILLPKKVRTRIDDFFKTFWEKFWAWGAHPMRLSIMGIVLSVGMIQLVMRQCFLLTNVLLAEVPPVTGWLWRLLLTKLDALRVFYFAGLMVGAAVVGGLFLMVIRRERASPFTEILTGLLGFLFLVQLLLLPINYGTLIADKTMPRVTSLGNDAMSQNQEAWLVFEGTEGITYLVRETVDSVPRRRLITFDRKEVKKIEIAGYDPILRVLFAYGEKE